MVEARYVYHLDTDEQVYQRRVNVGPEWQRLDLGWLSGGCSVVILKNERKKLPTIPTKEQQIEIDGAVVDVSFQGLELTTAFSVHPDRDARIPLPSLRMFARCRLGTARLHITAFPE